MTRNMRGDRASVRVARMVGSSVRRKPIPWRTAIPRSSMKARIWLMMPVRCDTSRSRTRCSACRSSCSAVLVATNFIVGAARLPAIASASLKSFFCPCYRGEHIWPASTWHRDQATRVCGSGDVRRRRLPCRSGKAVYWRAALPLGHATTFAATRWRRAHRGLRRGTSSCR